MSFSESLKPLLTRAEYHERWQKLHTALGIENESYTRRRGEINGEAQQLEALYKEWPLQGGLKDKWLKSVATWKRFRLERLDKESSERRKPILHAMRELDSTYKSQKIQDADNFIKDISLMIGLPETASRDDIVGRLREIMNPAPIVPRFSATLNVKSEHQRITHAEPITKHVWMTGRVTADGEIKVIKMSDRVTVIPPGAKGTYEDAQRDRLAEQIIPENETTFQRMKRESNERLYKNHQARRETVQ